MAVVVVVVLSVTAAVTVTVTGAVDVDARRRRLAIVDLLRWTLIVRPKPTAPGRVPEVMRLLGTVAVAAFAAIACGPAAVERPEPLMAVKSPPLPPRDWPDNVITDSSRLTFSVEGLEDPDNHNPLLRITLRNVTWGEPLWVKYRVGASVNDYSHRDVVLDVLDGPPLREIACSHCGGRGAVPSDAYLQLGSQSSISFLAGIYCSPLSPGHYRLVAHYHDNSNPAPEFPLSANRFAGSLTSAPFEIDVSPLQRP